MAESSGEKSFDPSPYRRQQAREKGQAPYSQDIASATILVVGAGLVWVFGASVAASSADIMRRMLSEPISLVPDERMLSGVTTELLTEVASKLAPIVGLLLVAGVAVSVGQVGFLFVPEKLQPDLGRLNPIAGLGRLFSVQGFARLGFGLFKVLVVAVTVVAALSSRAAAIVEASSLDTGPMAELLVDTTFRVVFWVGLALLALALADLWLQRWKHEQDLRMTAQEVKEELRNLQGNPEVIARRRQVQRQLAMGRLRDAVPKADVVVTNPTELAVALRYDAATMAAPVVVAKGAGVLAQRIRRLALEHGVPIVERKPLARLLYKEVKLNRPVPADSYAAVAEVLAYVYRLKGKKPPRGPRAA